MFYFFKQKTAYEMRISDWSSDVCSSDLAATNVDGWTSDYAMMRLSQVAGRPIWAMTEDGQPVTVISQHVPATSLADAFDRDAAMKGKRWRFARVKVYLLGGREWPITTPANSDIEISCKEATASNKVSA